MVEDDHERRARLRDMRSLVGPSMPRRLEVDSPWDERVLPCARQANGIARWVRTWPPAPLPPPFPIEVWMLCVSYLPHHWRLILRRVARAFATVGPTALRDRDDTWRPLQPLHVTQAELGPHRLRFHCTGRRAPDVRYDVHDGFRVIVRR